MTLDEEFEKAAKIGDISRAKQIARIMRMEDGILKTCSIAAIDQEAKIDEELKKRGL